MIEKIVDSFVNRQLDLGIMQEKDVSVYRYGYTLMFESVINFVLSMLIAILIGEVMSFLVFFVLFVPLRSFCGGYHAKKAWRCIVLSNMVVIATILLSAWMVQQDFPIIAGLVVEVFMVAILIRVSPVESENKKLSVAEKKFYKKCATVVVLVEVVIGIILLLIESVHWFWMICLVHAVEVVALMVVKMEL